VPWEEASSFCALKIALRDFSIKTEEEQGACTKRCLDSECGPQQRESMDTYLLQNGYIDRPEGGGASVGNVAIWGRIGLEGRACTSRGKSEDVT